VLGELIKEMQAALVKMDELEECLRDLKPPLRRGASTQQFISVCQFVSVSQARNT